MEKTDVKTCHIECDCGSHLLQIKSDVEYFDDTVSNKTRVRQEYQFAMFYYGFEKDKNKIWNRIVIAWKYLRTGKMFSDQMCLTPDEAVKLSEFIKTTLIKTEK